MRILVIEDDERAVTYLRKGLSEAGYVVESALHGEDGLELATTQPYDLIILDVMLPRRNGWSVMTELRRQVDTPVIFLTAPTPSPTASRALSSALMIIFSSPFAFSELLARIRTVLRRGLAPQVASLCVADLELDLVGHRARRGGQQLVLTAKEFSLLALMARHRGEVLTRTQIAELV